jgi:predicted nucleic acid-binding protein
MALVIPRDQHYRACAEAFKNVKQPLGTVWPVLAEVMYLVSDVPNAQAAVWTFIERGAIQILPLGSDDVPRIRELMQTYAGLPMDLADAALVRVAEREGTREFFTVDKKDFSVYRLHGRVRPKIIP